MISPTGGCERFKRIHSGEVENMIKLKGLFSALRGTVPLLVVALLAMGLSPLLQAATARAADEAPAKAWKNITLIYTTDIKGKIEPCG